MLLFTALVTISIIMTSLGQTAYSQYSETCEYPKQQKAFHPIELEYKIDGGSILQICAVEKNPEVVAVVDAHDDGLLTIHIPKKLVYSLGMNCEQGPPLILENGKEIAPIKTSTSASENIFTVGFTKGKHNIAFIGTMVIPGVTPDQYCGIVMGLDSLYMPPKFQIERGVKAEQVRCNEGLVIAIKASNENPVCVTYNTGVKLIERDWSVCSEQINYGRDNPCGPHSSTGVSLEPIKETFLSKTVDEWKNMSEAQLDPYYQKYKDDFFIELGRFLIKDEMRKELQKLGIENIHEDFKVFSGTMLTSLPPHISYHAVVNATDGKTYLLGGGVFANKIGAARIDQLPLYSEVLNPPKIGSGRTPPAWGLLSMEPRVAISQQKDTAPLAEPYSLILDLEKNNRVAFYNNLTIPIRIQEQGSGFIKDEDKLAWKSSIILPKQSGFVQFNATGNYEWDARSPPSDSGQWWENQGGGQIAVFSNETQNLPFEEKISIARVFLDNARQDIPWSGMGSTDKGVYIMLNDAIFYMIPDAEKYYEARAKQWIPFDVPIIIEVPKTLETPKVLETTD
ncbi:MAG: hypothetical protein ABI337_03870 [Nitrososphaera sp.]